MRRMLFFDIDGTLVNSRDRTIPDSTGRAHPAGPGGRPPGLRQQRPPLVRGRPPCEGYGLSRLRVWLRPVHPGGR